MHQTCDSIQSYLKQSSGTLQKQSGEGVCWVITERELQQLFFQGPSADNASNTIPQGQRLEEEEEGGNCQAIPHLPPLSKCISKQKRRGEETRLEITHWL